MKLHALALGKLYPHYIFIIRALKRLSHPLVRLSAEVNYHICLGYCQNIGGCRLVAVRICSVLYDKRKLYFLTLADYLGEPIVLREHRAEYRYSAVVLALATARSKAREKRAEDKQNRAKAQQSSTHRLPPSLHSAQLPKRRVSSSLTKKPFTLFTCSSSALEVARSRWSILPHCRHLRCRCVRQ